MHTGIILDQLQQCNDLWKISYIFKILLITSHHEFTLQQKYPFQKVAGSNAELQYRGLMNANKLSEQEMHQSNCNDALAMSSSIIQGPEPRPGECSKRLDGLHGHNMSPRLTPGSPKHGYGSWYTRLLERSHPFQHLL